VNQTWLSLLNAVPTPTFALDVQRAAMPGPPGARRADLFGLSVVTAQVERLKENSHPPDHSFTVRRRRYVAAHWVGLASLVTYARQRTDAVLPRGYGRMHVHPKIAWGELDQGRDESDRQNKSLVRTSAAIGEEGREWVLS